MNTLRYKIIAVMTGCLVIGFGCAWFRAAPKALTATVISTRPHDPAAYTQGLQLHDGFFWESTGLYGQSTVRKVHPDDGAVLHKHALPPNYFGEGLVLHNGELWVLTWRERTAFVLDPGTFATNQTHHYDGEGWGLTSDGEHLIMSDGTSALQVRSAGDFALIRKIAVTENGTPVNNLNELEFARGKIYANVYMTDRIIEIDPRRGTVTATVDLSMLRTQLIQPHQAEVLNGIAYDNATGHFFVTGKRWPQLFEVKLHQ